MRHGSAYTVVRAMNAFNGKCRFSVSCSSDTLGPIITKLRTIDYEKCVSSRWGAYSAPPSAGFMPTEARGNYLPEAPYLRETKTVRPV